MDLNKKVKFLLNRGLSLAYFGKDLHKFIKGSEDCKIFGVFTRSCGDELYYPEGDMNTFGNWIRCGDPTGLLPEWRDVDAPGYKLKVYLAGENGKEKALGVDHTSTLDTVNNLGVLYRNQGKLNEAEEFYKRALKGYKALGTDHTSTLNTVNNLGILYYDEGKLKEAEDMFQRALKGYEKL